MDSSTPDPTAAPAPQAKQQRTYLNNFFAMLNLFQPTLVNDKNEVWTGEPGQVAADFKWNGQFHAAPGVDPDKLPTFGQFINNSFAARSDLKGHIQLHEGLKKVLAETQRAFAEVEKHVLKQTAKEEELQPLATITEVARIVHEHKQMKDVLEFAASSSPEQALKAAQGWVFKNGIIPTVPPSPHGEN